MFIEGDEVEVVCVKVEIKKGKEKQQFAFKEDCGDETPIHFNPKIKVSEGESVRGKIITIERPNKAYILQRL